MTGTKTKKSTNSLLEISTLSVNYWTKFWWGDETEYHIDILDIVFMNLLFPLPVVKRFSKIVHLLYTWSGMFLYLTSLSLMSFTDSSHSDAESIQKNHGKTNTDKQFDHVMCFGTFDIFHPVLPLGSAKVRMKNDNCDRSRCSGYPMKVKNSDRWWGHTPDSGSRDFSWCACHPLRLEWYIRTDSHTCAWPPCIRIWSASARREDSRTLFYYRDSPNRVIWDG